MFKKIAALLAFLRGDDSPSFNEAELKLLSFLREALPEEEKATLAAQISAVRLVQRQNLGRIHVVYYRKPESTPLFPYPGYEHCLAKVSYKSNGKTKTTALVLHDGRLMTFERNVPLNVSDIESLVKVVLHPDGFKSVTDEIDAEEHG